jgi:hypothetical protein
MCRVLLRNPEGNSPLERPTYRWKDVNMKIKKKTYAGRTWTGLIWFRRGTRGGLL